MRTTHNLSLYHRYVGVGFLTLLAACGQEVVEAPEESTSAVADTTDNGVAREEATVSLRQPPAGWSTNDGLEVTVEFTGRYLPSTGEMVFEFEEPSVPVSENGLRTTGQALWCADRLTILQDGVSGSNPPNTLELVTNSVGTYADCNPATFPDSTPSGTSYANLVDSDGALCASISVRSFYPYELQQVYAWIYEVNPIDNYAYTFGDRSIDGLGNGAEPPSGMNAPSDNRGGLFYYGDINANDPSGVVDNAISTLWVFRYPSDGAEFNFRGRLVARFNEVCNGSDDDCDGRIDEGSACFSEGIFCVDNTDCGLAEDGVTQLECLENGVTGQFSCGGGLAPEDCDGDADTNGDSLPGCLDPTCAEDPACPDFSCLDGNLGSTLSALDGQYVRRGDTGATAVSDFSLPVGLALCGSRMPGADSAYLFTAPVAGSYLFSTAGSAYDTALVVIRGICPIDFPSASQSGAICSDTAVGGTGEETLSIAMTAGETITVIVDSALPPTSTLGGGEWKLSVFKAPNCGDSFHDRVDRLGNPEEECDPGATSTAACDDDCTLVECNDGYLNTTTEGCEDGNLSEGDGCSALCQPEVGYDCSGGPCLEVCGDGIVVPGGLETCDDANTEGGDGCSVSCTDEGGWNCPIVGEECVEVCGDAETVGDEVCDSPLAVGCRDCVAVNPGYRCPPDGGSCSDINECVEDLDECSVDGVCTNLAGSYSCSCLPDDLGDGFICVDVNECLVDNGGCDENAECINQSGERTCECRPGWSGNGLVCDDVDECLVNNGGCDALVECYNLPAGSSTCGDCPPGYSGTTVCQPLNCGTPPDAGPNSALQSGWTGAAESTAVYACTAGFSIDGTPEASKTYAVTCTDGTGWVAPADTSCEVFECDALAGVTGATLAYLTSSGTSTTLRSYLHEAVYSRQTGYRLDAGNASRVCQADGTWTGTSPVFTRMQCPEILNSGLVVTYRNGATVDSSRHVGWTASFACVSGYTATPGTVQTCRETNNTSVEWQVGSGPFVQAATPACVDNNECLGNPTCGTGASCNNIAGSYQCVCDTASGWYGTTTTAAPATCAPQCGDSITVASETCDSGAGNLASAPFCEGTSCTWCPSTAAGAALACRTQTATLTAGACSSGIDEDLDGRTDCADPDCRGVGTCPAWQCTLNPGAVNEFRDGFLGTINGTTVGQARHYAVPTSTSSPDYAVLWRAPSAGSYTITTCGGTTNYNSAIAVYGSMSCQSPSMIDINNGVLVASNDNSACGTASTVTVTAAQGELLTLVVGGYQANQGNFSLSISRTYEAVCGNSVVDVYPHGVGSFRVPHISIDASSNWDNNAPGTGHHASRGRLNWEQGWSALINYSDQWWRVDFRTPVSVAAVATQGRYGSVQRVTQYQVQYSNDNVNWTNAGGTYGGNYDSNTVIPNWFSRVTARYWRLRPTVWNAHISMRAEVYSHYETCDDGNVVTDNCAYGQTFCSVCTNDCRTGPGVLVGRCGDSVTQSAFGETCDDGNAVTDNCAYGQTSCTVCRNTCTNGAGNVVGRCGDGVVQGVYGETCDDGANNGVPGRCNTSCNGRTACPAGYVNDCNGNCGLAAWRTDGTCDNAARTNIWGYTVDFYCDSNPTPFPTEICRCNPNPGGARAFGQSPSCVWQAESRNVCCGTDWAGACNCNRVEVRFRYRYFDNFGCGDCFVADWTGWYNNEYPPGFPTNYCSVFACN